MRIAAPLATVLALALVGIGIFATDVTESPMDSLESEPGVEASEAPMNGTIEQFVGHTFQLASAQAHSFDIDVPTNASTIRFVVTGGAGVYSGPISWTGVGDCDGNGGTSGPTVNAGTAGGGFGVCMLEPGIHTVTFTVPTGAVQVTVDAYAFVVA